MVVLKLTESCDPSYPDYCIKPSETDLDCDWDGIVEDDEIPDKNFKVGKDDPHGFDGKDDDGIGCESNRVTIATEISPLPQLIVNNEGPDGDCLFDPNLPKCASVDGDCPDGFFQNGYEQCVPVRRLSRWIPYS